MKMPPRAAFSLLVLAALACNIGGLPAATPTRTPSFRPTQHHTPTPVPPTPIPPTATALPPITAARPLVWFAPLPPLLVEIRHFVGSEDFPQLFEPDAPWTEAASHIQVFKLYSEFLATEASDAELKHVVDGLNQRGIALAMEVGAIRPNPECDHIEGFGGPDDAHYFPERIRMAGGALRFVVFDAPYAAGHFYDGPARPCHWTAERIAEEVDVYVQTVRTIFPDVIPVDIEPLWVGIQPADYEDWWETFQQTTGYNFAMLDMDNDFNRPDWPEANLEIERFAREHGIEYGITYFGNWDDTSDAEWLAHAEERMVEFEVRHGGQPDHVIFQSWQPHPDFSLPETTPNTYTWAINRYFRPRTALSLELQQPGDGSAAVAGALTQSDGPPLAGAEVGLTLNMRAGAGVYNEFTLSGVVPAGASSAVVGYRVNDECGCSGPADFSIYSVAYRQGGETASRVPNGQFSQGLDYWGLWGDGQASLQTSDHGPGRMLHVTADPGQVAGANDGPIAVTAGAEYTVTFAARVSPASAGSGYFALVFTNGVNEITRVQIPLEAPDLQLGAAVTAADGSFEFALPQPPGTGNTVAAVYAGDDQYWPSYAEALAP